MKRLKQYIAGTAAAIMLISTSCMQVQAIDETVLETIPDSSGLKAWTNVLKSGKEQGAKMAQGGVDSDEVKKRNLSHDAYIWA